MTSLVRRGLGAGSGLLMRLLEDPELAVALRELPAPALRQVILKVGLEDAGELVALASLEQLRDVFDEDLWASAAPGEDEEFDAERFVLWLEVLLEGGEEGVADRLAELSEDFLVFAVARIVRVLDAEVLARWAADTADAAHLLDEIVDERPSLELDAHLLVAHSERGWDAVRTTLVALDERHPQHLRAVLERCAAATHDEVRSAGELDQVLRGEERLLEDARAEREDRRAGQGYVAPSDARAFLALARTAPDGPEEDPITRIYFRERKSEPAGAAATPDAASSAPPPSLRTLLLEAGIEAPAREAPEPQAGSLFRQTMAALHEEDPARHQRVLEELAYLANILVAGDTTRAKPWQPVEAAERVLELCDAGLSQVAAADPSAAQAALQHWGAVGLFRLAWSARSG